jgi:hypothetical protein
MRFFDTMHGVGTFLKIAISKFCDHFRKIKKILGPKNFFSRQEPFFCTKLFWDV